jgi:threonylcarbamoyladenosine tRNA methylthiotransferase MtaB
VACLHDPESRGGAMTAPQKAPQSSPKILTFGCRLNAFESELMGSLTSRAGADSDLVIVNTCAVTAEAERQARQAIRRLRRERPLAQIVVTGCGAQIDPGRWAAMPEVDRVVGNQEKLKLETWTQPAPTRVEVADIMTVRESALHLVDGFGAPTTGGPTTGGRARAFLEVQQGCDHRCTFCIIPFGRGNSRSAPMAHIVEQARALAAKGYAEVVLTGVDLTAYGNDLANRTNLGKLVREILASVPELPRLRLSSLDPVEIDDDLLHAFAEEPRLMPHAHLSLQAGDDMILKRMKRRHSRADAIRVCRELRHARPDVVFGADLIAGFPTETEEMFEQSLALIDDCDLVWLHVFPYSSRPGTPAAKMPQVPIIIRKSRAARLREKGAAARMRWALTRVGDVAEVVVEETLGGNSGKGRDAYFAAITFDGESAGQRFGALTAGKLATVRIAQVRQNEIHAELLP